MRVIAASILVLGFVASWAIAGDRRDELFASWAEAQRDVKTLVVEFSQKAKDPLVDKWETTECTFRLLRTPNGEVFASYEFGEPVERAVKRDRWTGLLNNGTVYLLNHDKKTAIRFEYQKADDLRRFLEEYFNPFVRLLDRKSAEENWRLEVVKQDEWYTYLTVKPKQVQRRGRLPDRFNEGRVVVMNKSSPTVPKDMPRQLWFSDAGREYAFEIKAWRINPAEAPRIEEFAKPEDRPGWQVSDWLFGRNRQLNPPRR